MIGMTNAANTKQFAKLTGISLCGVAAVILITIFL